MRRTAEKTNFRRNYFQYQRFMQVNSPLSISRIAQKLQVSFFNAYICNPTKRLKSKREKEVYDFK